MKFEKEYPIEGQLRLNYIHESGMVFGIIPLVGLDMNSGQIKAELKVARMKLNEAVIKWENKHLNKQRVKEALSQIRLKTRDEDYIEFQGRILRGIRKELGLEEDEDKEEKG